MSRERPDEEAGVVETLPGGSDPGPGLVPEDIPIVPADVGAEADMSALEQQR